MEHSVSPFDATSILLYISTIILLAIPLFILFPPIPVERSDALRQTHTKLGVHPRNSNLRDQRLAIHQAKSGKPGTVKSLYVYPVKSCRGIELSRSRVLPSGLEFDRLFMFAQLRAPRTTPAGASAELSEDDSWEFVTLRQLPLLANIKVDIWLPDKNKTSRQLGKLSDAFIVIRFPWTDKGFVGLLQRLIAKISRGLSGVPEKEIMLPLEFPPKHEIEACGYKYSKVKIWDDIVDALNMKTELPPELKLYIGAKREMALFRMDPSKQREVFDDAPTKEVLGYQPVIDFQDAYPLHLLSLSSVQDLTSKVNKDENMQHLDARRFRANIIISGTDSYDEDTWKGLRLKSIDGKELQSDFDVSCRTTRCKLPNVDPDTGIRHRAEPDHALRKYRNVDESTPKLGCFGVQLCPVFPSSRGSSILESFVEVGMQIDHLDKVSHLHAND